MTKRGPEAKGVADNEVIAENARAPKGGALRTRIVAKPVYPQILADAVAAVMLREH
jgi:hypothetical protein